MNGLTERVAATIRRKRMIGHGQRIGVAVSGGADSVCLLHVLRELALAPLTVLHLDHQLRGEESRADAAFVADLARGLGLPLLARAVELGPGNLEEAGRRARLDFFQDAIRSGAVDRVATGHTRSDQAETVLFRVLRGAGGAGLAGIRPVTSDGLIRPLLDVERAEVERYLSDRKLPWREDSTNASRRFARNRLRHDLLPALERDWNPNLSATLARTAEWADAEAEYWRAEVDRLEAALAIRQGDAVLIDASALRQLPLAAARRLVRRALERAKGDLRAIGFDHTDQALDLAAAGRGSGFVRLPGVEVRRSQNWLRFANFSPPKPADGYRIAAPVPGITPIPGSGRGVCLELIEKAGGLAVSDCVYNGEMGCVDWDRVSDSLVLRSWLPGDRYQPVQSARVKKLKTLFQLARIPSWDRRDWPVLASGDAIVWTRRFGPAAEFAAGPATRIVLTVRETDAG